MRVKLIFFNILLIAVILIGCNKAEVPTGPKKEVDAYDEEVVNVETPVRMDLNVDSSNIEVYSWKSKKVKLEIKKIIRGVKSKDKLKKELDNFDISIKQENNRVILMSEYHGKIKSPIDYRVDFKIYIPKKIHSLSLKMDTGKVKFYDDIDCFLRTDVNMANIEINRFEGVIQARANMGDIRITCGSMKSGSSIKTDMGNINARSKIESSGEYSFETGIGNINLVFPKTSAIKIESVGNLEVNEFSTSTSGAKVKVCSEMGKISIKKY